MQPTNDEYRSEPTGGWQPPSWSAPAPPYAPPPATASITKARPWRIAIVSFATLFVLIATLGNQWVVDAIVRHTNASTFGDNVVLSVRTYQWRFNAPRGGDFGHFWLGSLALVGAALVVTLLLVAVVTRGPGGFWQSFFGAWMAVVVATMLAVYVRDLVLDTRALTGAVGVSRTNAIFFSGFAPGPTQFAASLGFGLIVALVAGLTAVLSRRTEVVAASAMPGAAAAQPAFGAPFPMGEAPAEADRPWTAPPAAPVPGPTGSPSPWASTSSPWSSSANEPSGGTPTPADSEPPAPDTGEHTAVLPDVEQAPTASPSARRDDDDDTQATTQFSRTSDTPMTDEGAHRADDESPEPHGTS
jgi:hypothetical protein